MRINSMKLRDFRCHQSLSLRLDRLNFVVAENAAGKSSIAMAIEFALTGKCQVTDNGGRGSEDLVRLGARELQIDLEISADGNTGTISRTKGRSHELRLGDRVLPLPEAQRKLYEVLGVGGDVLSACLNASRFLGMDEKAQKTLLAQVLASDAVKVTKEIRDDVLSIGTEGPGWDGGIESIADIDGYYKNFFRMRTEANRDIKALGSMEAPEEPEADYSEQKSVLEGLRRDLTIAERAKARAEERYNSIVESNKHTSRMVEQRKSEANQNVLPNEELANLDARMADSEKAQKIAAKIKSLESSLVAKKGKIDREISSDIARLTQASSDIRTSIEETESVVMTVLSLKGTCPTCQRGLKDAEKEKIEQTLGEKLAKLRRSLEEAGTELGSAGARNYPDEIDQQEIDLRKLRRELEEIGDIAAAENKLRGHREAMVEIGRCDRDLKEIKDPPALDTSFYAEPIKQLTERIAKGEEVINSLRDAKGKHESYKLWQDRKAGLELRVATLERLVEFFGPNGIKSQMVGDKIGPFTERLNGSLAGFGYRVKFSIEPYEFLVDDGRNLGFRKLHMLSDSEQLRFGLSFSIALSLTVGLRFVIVDKADMLLKEQRNSLAALLMESELEQAIVLMSSDEVVPEELPDGVKFVQIGERAAVAA